MRGFASLAFFVAKHFQILESSRKVEQKNVQIQLVLDSSNLKI